MVDTDKNSLCKEAMLLSKLLSIWITKNYNDYDLVGAYILSSLAIRKPNRFITSKLKIPIVEEESLLIQRSNSICDFEGLTELININYLSRKLNEDIILKGLTIAQLFNRLMFNGIKKNNNNYVNASIVNWCLATYRFKLLFHIPTPIEVLVMQADRERVITMFTDYDNLCKKHTAKLHYMKGQILHSRDPLEFLLHDMKHMEHFANNDIFHEQVGFFRKFMNLPKYFIKDLSEQDLKSCKYLKFIFTHVLMYDSTLWKELEYLISDMNCHSTHLLQYFIAKLLEAENRSLATSSSSSTIMYGDCDELLLGPTPPDQLEELENKGNGNDETKIDYSLSSCSSSSSCTSGVMLLHDDHNKIECYDDDDDDQSSSSTSSSTSSGSRFRLKLLLHALEITPSSTLYQMLLLSYDTLNKNNTKEQQEQEQPPLITTQEGDENILCSSKNSNRPEKEKEEEITVGSQVYYGGIFNESQGREVRMFFKSFGVL